MLLVPARNEMEARALALPRLLGSGSSGVGLGVAMCPCQPCRVVTGHLGQGTRPVRAQLCGSSWSTVSESRGGCSLSLRMFVLKRELPQMFWGHKREEGTSAVKMQR